MENKQVKTILDAARRDAVIIMASLGVIGTMTLDADRVVRESADLAMGERDDPNSIGTGQRMLTGWAATLKETRVRIASLLEYLGDDLNSVDAVSPEMEALSSPVFDMINAIEPLPFTPVLVQRREKKEATMSDIDPIKEYAEQAQIIIDAAVDRLPRVGMRNRRGWNCSRRRHLD